LLFCPWLEPAEWFDSRGPNKTAAWLGVDRDIVSRFTSPIDVTLLRGFAASARLAAGDPLYEVMRFIGADLISYLETVRAQIAFVRGHAERWSLPADGGPIEAVFLPRTDPLPEGPSASVGAFVRAEGLRGTVAAIVYPDRRGGGYGVGRYEDHPGLDFSRVEAEPDVHFAHKSGFMCKTTATEPARLQALIQVAWRAPEPLVAP